MAEEVKKVAEQIASRQSANLGSDIGAIGEVVSTLRDYQFESSERLSRAIKSILQVGESQLPGHEINESRAFDLITLILFVFNEAMNSALLKVKNGDFHRRLQNPKPAKAPTLQSLIAELEVVSKQEDEKHQSEKRMVIFEQMLNSRDTDPKILIANLLKKDSGFEFLIEITQKELEIVFEKLSDEDLIKLWKIFNSPVVLNLLKGAEFFAREPEKFPPTDAEFNDEIFARAVHNVNEFIRTPITALKKFIKTPGAAKALDGTSAVRVIIVEGMVEPRDVEKVEEVAPFVLKFLQQIMNDFAVNDPSRHHIITIREILEQLKKPSRRQSLPTLTLLPNRERRKSDPSLREWESSTIMVQPTHRSPVQEAQIYSPPNTNSSIVVARFEPPTVDIQSNPKEDWVIIYSDATDLPKPEEIRKCYDVNSISALFGKGPFVRLTTGLAFNRALRQFFTLYPQIRAELIPYFIIGDLIGGTVGIIVGRNAILYPNVEPRMLLKTLSAASEGLLIFVFTLGGIIKIYLMRHPEVQYMDEEQFFPEFVLAPFLLSMGYTVFHSLSNARRAKYFPDDSGWYYVKIGLHALTSFLLYGSIFQITALNFANISNDNLYYLLIPAVLSLGTTAVQLLSRFGDTVKSLLSYIGLTNFLYMAGRDSVRSYDQSGMNAESISDLARSAFYVAAGSYAIFFMIRQGRGFLLVYKSEGPIIVRIIKPRDLDRGLNLVEMLDDLSSPAERDRVLRQRLIPASDSEGDPSVLFSDEVKHDAEQRALTLRADPGTGIGVDLTAGAESHALVPALSRTVHTDRGVLPLPPSPSQTSLPAHPNSVDPSLALIQRLDDLQGSFSKSKKRDGCDPSAPMMGWSHQQTSEQRGKEKEDVSPSKKRKFIFSNLRCENISCTIL